MWSSHLQCERNLTSIGLNFCWECIRGLGHVQPRLSPVQHGFFVVLCSEGARSEGAIGGSQPVKSRNFGHHGSIFSGRIWDDCGRWVLRFNALRSLADDVSRSIIQYGLHEASSHALAVLFVSHESIHAWISCCAVYETEILMPFLSNEFSDSQWVLAILGSPRDLNIPTSHSSKHVRKTHMRKAAYMSVYSELPSQNVVYHEQGSHSGLKKLDPAQRDFDTGRDRARLCSPMLSSAGPPQRAFRWAQSKPGWQPLALSKNMCVCMFIQSMGINLKVLDRMIIAMTVSPVRKLFLDFSKPTCCGRKFHQRPKLGRDSVMLAAYQKHNLPLPNEGI